MKSVGSLTSDGDAGLGTEDVRALLRIVHELHDEQVPLAVRLGTLARQVCVLTRARRCHIGAVDARRATWPLGLTVCAEFGWMDDSDVRLMMSALRDAGAVDEMAMGMARGEEGESGIAPGVLTRTAMGMLGEAGWRGNRLYDLYLRPVAVDDVIQSRLADALGPERHGWIAMVRDRADGLFEERDALVVDALHAEIGPWLWRRVGADLARGGAAEAGTHTGAVPTRSAAELLARLSPTQRRVLPYMLKGCTEEEIAIDLNRSKHTVHDHAKRIYDALGVKSRIDLVITFQNAGWDGRMADTGEGARSNGR